MARIVWSQPAFASICERINSEFAFVKDNWRNKLGREKANKLVALLHNLRLLSRMKEPLCCEPAVGWNNEEGAEGRVGKLGIVCFQSTTTIVQPN